MNDPTPPVHYPTMDEIKTSLSLLSKECLFDFALHSQRMIRNQSKRNKYQAAKIDELKAQSRKLKHLIEQQNEYGKFNPEIINNMQTVYDGPDPELENMSPHTITPRKSDDLFASVQEHRTILMSTMLDAIVFWRKEQDELFDFLYTLQETYTGTLDEADMFNKMEAALNFKPNKPAANLRETGRAITDTEHF